jgi:putative transcriptional regulator
MENQELVNQIKVQRAIKNITQEELAAQIGVTRKTINTIENGVFIPSTILAIKLARFFEIKVEELFTLVEKEY